MMKKNSKVEYRCALCGDFESADPSNVTRHIKMSKDEKHGIENPPEYVDEITCQTIEAIELSFDSSIENTAVGDWYHGRVSGIKGYGLFVNLAERADGTDLSGLVHHSNIAGLYTPRDYKVGDEVIVERLEGGDGGKLSLRLVTDPDGNLLTDQRLTGPEPEPEPEPEQSLEVAIDLPFVTIRWPSIGFSLGLDVRDLMNVVEIGEKTLVYEEDGEIKAIMIEDLTGVE